MKGLVLILFSLLAFEITLAQDAGNGLPPDSLTSLPLLSVALGTIHPDLHRLQVKPREDYTKKTFPSGRMLCGSCGSDSTHKPIYVLETLEKDINLGQLMYKVKPDYIQKISILKSPETISRFGEAGKNGVILITLKEEYLEKFLKEVNISPG
jgi:hypothetical protein